MATTKDTLIEVTNNMYQVAWKYGDNNQLARALDAIDELLDKSDNGYQPPADNMNHIVADTLEGISYQDTVRGDNLQHALEAYAA